MPPLIPYRTQFYLSVWLARGHWYCSKMVQLISLRQETVCTNEKHQVIFIPITPRSSPRLSVRSPFVHYLHPPPLAIFFSTLVSTFTATRTTLNCTYPQKPVFHHAPLHLLTVYRPLHLGWQRTNSNSTAIKWSSSHWFQIYTLQIPTHQYKHWRLSGPHLLSGQKFRCNTGLYSFLYFTY